MTDSECNPSGSVYSSSDWLDNHHATKIRLRSELIQKLPIWGSDHVLDVGCATGNWSVLAAEKVGVTGRIVGIDVDECSVKAAKERMLLHPLNRVFEFECCELDSYLSSNAEKFDVILLFNVLSYPCNPTKIIQFSLKKLKPNGRLFIKDTDIGSDFYWPDPENLFGDISNYIKTTAQNKTEDFYNPFFARRLPEILNELGSVKISTLSQSFTLIHPLSLEEKSYIMGNVTMLADVAKQKGAEALSERWLSQFNEDLGDVLSMKSFMYSMTEFVFQVTRT